MLTHQIKLDNAYDKMQYLKIAKSCGYDIDIKRGHNTIDGKSVLGVLALDMANGVDLRLYTDDILELKKFEQFWR